MEAGKSWVGRLQIRTVRWLVKGPGGAWVIAGTLGLAGFGAAALNAPAGASGQLDRGTLATPAQPAYSAHCYADPDGDGHIFCDSTVSISSLPASYGYCFRDDDGDGRVICEGTGH